ncbi:uncharacterized protein LOC130433578 isoform X2 [Triplophysa dalaica]|uniref:uncharacterized protein LOC130433578 isoform X2 n=1 Tax=Triplophysa dalaica TaxID=1582913 RepID=UPI0024E006F9|nr:uncharacterized protein LOC130433578 isoform X2 [Triplophysa dalaica]
MSQPTSPACLNWLTPPVNTSTKTPQDMVKYLVYEDRLLELFKICPTCSRVCRAVTFINGTFLSVTQKCLHQSCLFTREWKSQPLLSSTPAGNLHLSAAVYYTGSSFIQTNKTNQLVGLKQKQNVSLGGGDMRADSPGRCAKYGSYSMMDLSTNKIVDIQLVQNWCQSSFPGDRPTYPGSKVSSGRETTH